MVWYAIWIQTTSQIDQSDWKIFVDAGPARRRRAESILNF